MLPKPGTGLPSGLSSLLLSGGLEESHRQGGPTSACRPVKTSTCIVLRLLFREGKAGVGGCGEGSWLLGDKARLRKLHRFVE